MKIEYVFFGLLAQDLLQKSNATDASGNVVLSDFGVHMQQKVCSCQTLCEIDFVYDIFEGQYKA